VGLIVVGRHATERLPEILSAIREAGTWGVAAYFALYFAWTVAGIPASVLTVAAGVIYGLFPGWGYAMLAQTAGATGAFLVARYLARRAVEQRLGGSARVAAIDRAIAREGGRFVLLLRLTPIFPYNVMNFALGITGVRTWSYVWGSFLGMGPFTFAWAYVGYATGQLALGAPVGPRGPAGWAMLAAAAAATIGVAVYVTSVVRSAVHEVTDAGPS